MHTQKNCIMSELEDTVVFNLFIIFFQGKNPGTWKRKDKEE